MGKPMGKMTELVGRTLRVRTSVLAGVILVGVGVAGVVASYVAGHVAPAWVGLPMLSLALAVVPFALAYVFLATALTISLQRLERAALAGLAQVALALVFVALGAVLFLPRRLDPAVAFGEARLSGDAVALTVVTGLVGIGTGIAGHRRVAVRPFLFALLVPLIASWPDFLGSYVQLTEGFNAVFLRPEIGNNLRLSPKDVEAVQRSAGVSLQYLAASAAAIAGTTAAYLVKRLRKR